MNSFAKKTQVKTNKENKNKAKWQNQNLQMNISAICALLPP